MGHSHERPGFGGRRSVGDHQAGPEVIAQTSCLGCHKTGSTTTSMHQSASIHQSAASAANPFLVCFRF